MQTGEVLQQVAGMSALHTLRLSGSMNNNHALLSSLELCTQLTSLQLMAEIRDLWPGPGEQPVPHPPGFVGALQQLTGLCSLVVPGKLFAHDKGAWLAPLSQLTSLCVRVRWGPVQYAVMEGPVCQVQDWPAVWEQVVEGGTHFDDHPRHDRHIITTTCTSCRFTPAAPGAVPITLLTEETGWSCHGWSQPLVPCPHLPGVWELQGQVAGSSWSRSRSHTGHG
jgi:hypothetical protein